MPDSIEHNIVTKTFQIVYCYIDVNTFHIIRASCNIFLHSFTEVKIQIYIGNIEPRISQSLVISVKVNRIIVTIKIVLHEKSVNIDNLWLTKFSFSCEDRE